MKKVFLLMVMACMVTLTSCNYNFSTIGLSNQVAPKGSIVKKEYRQSPFTKIDIKAMANVKIIQGDANDYRVVLSAPENYIELFTFRVDNGELDVDFIEDNISIETENVDVTIYTPQLTELENSGLSSVEADRFSGNSLEVENSGVGTIYLNGLKFRKVEAECSGAGNIELSGTSLDVKLETSGVGSIKASALRGRDVAARVSGVGSIQCHAVQSIRGEVTGVGSLTYGGNPEEKHLNRNGVGNISPM